MIKSNNIIRHPIKSLTTREIEIMVLTAHGKTSIEISQILNISNGTVKEHLERTRMKLNAVNKTHAIVIAIMLGIIMPFEKISDNIFSYSDPKVSPPKGGYTNS